MQGRDFVKTHSHVVFSPHPKSYSLEMAHVRSTESPHLNVGSYQYHEHEPFQVSRIF